MKRWMTAIAFGAAGLFAVGGSVLPAGYWQGVVASSSASFLILGVGLLFVNVYLERSARQGAVKSLFILANTSIATFHNYFLDRCWAQFGRDEWLALHMDYLRANGKPEAMRQDARQFLYDLFESDTQFRTNLVDLEEMLVELTRLVGWDLDAELLEHCLDARACIAQARALPLDNTAASINQVTEHVLDADLHSQRVRDLLLKIAGVSERG